MATFAIKRLRETVDIPADYSPTNSTTALIKRYSREFEVERGKIKEMPFRVVKIEDQRVQYLFEAYAIISLGTTKYNTFETT